MLCPKIIDLEHANQSPPNSQIASSDFLSKAQYSKQREYPYLAIFSLKNFKVRKIKGCKCQKVSWCQIAQKQKVKQKPSKLKEVDFAQKDCWSVFCVELIHDSASGLVSACPRETHSQQVLAQTTRVRDQKHDRNSKERDRYPEVRGKAEHILQTEVPGYSQAAWGPIQEVCWITSSAQTARNYDRALTWKVAETQKHSQKASLT